MANITKRNKPLSVNPLKNSQAVGATLAFLGLRDAMPLMHGSQGCTAFAKVQFVRHFREAIPLQTTAVDQVSAVMGGEGNVKEALTTIFSKNQPRVIGLMTTGLTEAQGSDIQRAVKEFRAEQPSFSDRRVVPVNTPDFSGSLEQGYAAAVKAMVEHLVPARDGGGTEPGRRRRQVNVLAGAGLTPGDVEVLKETIESFELRPVVLPDLSDSLDGHLVERDFVPHTLGGTSLSEIEHMGDSVATLVIGPSMNHAADVLAARTGVPDFRFEHLMGLDAMDAFVHRLSLIAARPVPATLERQRAQLQDAMVDCHFQLGLARIAVAAEPDQLLAWSAFLAQMGVEIVAAVAPARGPALEQVDGTVTIGDLEDLERIAREQGAELFIGNSHCRQGAERAGVPLLAAGFPLHDVIGGYLRASIGYRGARQLLFDLANLRLVGHHGIHPYRSIYRNEVA